MWEINQKKNGFARRGIDKAMGNLFSNVEVPVDRDDLVTQSTVSDRLKNH